MSSLNLRFPRAKFWRKRSAVISDYDPLYKVIYLGNVLTGWAKGDGCVEKPLGTLWRNHLSSDKPNILMKVTISNSGLKAITKEHGLTEYWANRITFCAADPAFPKVFCWIYRHEGRKMKQELRCHAILCSSESKARQMSDKLQERIHQALVDFRKEKISRQNARLSLANSADENPSMPFRKILLQTGSSNYRSPTDKSKTLPKLKVIEEAEEEEEEEEYEEEQYGEGEEEYDRETLIQSNLRSFLQRDENNDNVDDHDDDEDEEEEEEDSEDDDDVVTDHLLTDSNRTSSRSLGISNDEIDDDVIDEDDSDIDKCSADTISDESGYAEEPVLPPPPPPPPPIPFSSPSTSSCQCSSSDIKKADSEASFVVVDYIGDDVRKNATRRKILNNNKLIPEFCINI